MNHDDMSAVFKDWNKGELDSFLIEISANILAYKVTQWITITWNRHSTD